ncbi:hypothetical protein BC351_33870 [Paenibacillus ferrarius]|uniref:Uncharacterized protein n=1 Tax=Paenibacillus ferrarius TaxID=1469647 RepID=A0A1V4HDM3_9BACL|nr:hypothetical protein BC351_33870 [Paenibacillus ferrarius]
MLISPRVEAERLKNSPKVRQDAREELHKIKTIIRLRDDSYPLTLFCLDVGGKTESAKGKTSSSL